ncbi:MAG: hypothetical protein ABL958_19520 [Bdellovibrionia bacterium]
MSKKSMPPVKAARGQLPFYSVGGVNVVAVEDVVQGIVSAFEKGVNGQRYILSGDNLTIQELLTAVANAAGRAGPRYKLPGWLLQGVGGVSDFLRVDSPLNRENLKAASLYHWFDNSKARRELDFSPGSSLEAIRSSVNWMQAQGLI